MRQQPFPRINQNHLLVVVGLLILVAVLRSGSGSILTTATVTSNWNTQVIDATKNGNAVLSLYLLQTNTNPTPVNASPRDVLATPSNYFGKYLQLSGTIQSVQTYPSQNNLLSLILGNTSEVVMVASDGMTVVDCLLPNQATNLNVGSNITINGYTPGVRYVQNSQGTITSELVIIGRINWQIGAST